MRPSSRMGVSGLPHGAAGSAAGQMNGTGFPGRRPFEAVALRKARVRKQDRRQHCRTGQGRPSGRAARVLLRAWIAHRSGRCAERKPNDQVFMKRNSILLTALLVIVVAALLVYGVFSASGSQTSVQP